jgi:hypothetical protein
VRSPDGIRSTITEDDFGDFWIVIPAQRHVLISLFLGVWLCGWVLGEFSAVFSLITRPPSLFLIFWLTLWTIAGLAGFLTLTWNIAGREVIRISEKFLEVRREIGPFAPSKTFEMSRIRSLRHSPFDLFAGPKETRVPIRRRVLGGSIAFDYESDFFSAIETHRFGIGLSEVESRRLIKTIHQRFKFPEASDVEPLPIHQG